RAGCAHTCAAWVGTVPARMVPYLHALDGRLRIKLVDVKGRAARAREVEERLRGLPGVELVTANPVTGNVLVLYDARRNGTDALIETLRGWGHLRDKAPPLPGGL